MKNNLPIIGQIYNYFDDGKIRESRKMEVEITDIIPFNDIDSETKKEWLIEVDECDWLYNPETDYFIKGILHTTDIGRERVIFVRDVNNGWFSLGWWGGSLDVDGEIWNNYLNSLG